MKSGIDDELTPQGERSKEFDMASKFYLGLLASCLAAAPMQATAEPGKTASYLMNTPATMMDVGMIRLQMSMDTAVANVRVSNKTALIAGTATYNWDSNQFELLITTTNRYENSSEFQSSARSIISAVRAYLGVHPETGIPEGLGGFSFASHAFTHPGFKLLNEPPDYFKTLDKMFVVNILGGVQGVGAFTCKGPLAGTQIFCGKQ